MISLNRFQAVLHPERWGRRQYVLLIAGAMLLVILVMALWWGLHAGQHPGIPQGHVSLSPAPLVPVQIQTVSLTAAPQYLEATGTVQSELETPVASKVMGRVRSILVREGDTVHQGQPLILLDARDLDAAVAQADANLRAANVGYDSARITARMEASLSEARISEAQARVAQNEAALQAANAKLELVQAGPRHQEREQAALAVSQAKTALELAESILNRMTSLYQQGAIAAQQFDQVKSQYEMAKAQYAAAQQAQSLADEGSRAEEIRAAQETVRQAQAALAEARARLKQAQANALQTDVRKQEIQGAQAQIGQSRAAQQMASILRDYAVIVSPFDGRVARRLADPGVMASPGTPLLTIQGGALRLEAVVPESAVAPIRQGLEIPVHFDALGGRLLTGRVALVAPQGDPNSHTFLVKIQLPQNSGAMPGMFGRARFTTGAEQRMLVPAAAVWEREGLSYLYVVDNAGVARLRMITVGEAHDGKLPVLSGLTPGERIVVSGRERLTDGSPVTEEAR